MIFVFPKNQQVDYQDYFVVLLDKDWPDPDGGTVCSPALGCYVNEQVAFFAQTSAVSGTGALSVPGVVMKDSNGSRYVVEACFVKFNSQAERDDYCTVLDKTAI